MRKADFVVAVKKAGFGQHVFDLDVDLIQNLLKVMGCFVWLLWVADKRLIRFFTTTTGNLRNADPIQHRRVLHKTVAPPVLSASFRTSTDTTTYGYSIDLVSSYVYRGTLSRTCFRLSTCRSLVDSCSESKSLSEFFADHGHIC